MKVLEEKGGTYDIFLGLIVLIDCIDYIFNHKIIYFIYYVYFIQPKTNDLMWK